MQPLTIEQPFDEVMVDGIRRFALREIADSVQRREARWSRDYRSAEAYANSIDSNREQFRTIIGLVDQRESGGDFELVAVLGGDGIVARSKDIVVRAIRWNVLPGVTAEGLILEPRDKPVARMVALPDADWTPEMFGGLSEGLGEHEPIARELAARGVQVVVPTIISRDDSYSGNKLVGYTNQPHREFIYRQAFQMGRHVIGYEVQRVAAAVDLLEELNRRAEIELPIGVVGVSEGGLLALYAAAIDTRIDGALVSGYFQPRERVWQEPIYRNVWSQLTEFGDVEIASLIAPRTLVIEACAVPAVQGPPSPRDGRRGAAPGRIETCGLGEVQSEFERAKSHYIKLGLGERIKLVVSGDGAGPSGSKAAIDEFLSTLGVSQVKPIEDTALELTDFQIDADARQYRQVQELIEFTQSLLRRSARVRDKFWSNANRSNVVAWKNSTEYYRNYVWEEMIGKLPPPTMPPNIRARIVLEDADFTGYEIAIDVYPDVIAAGILLLPTNLRPDEKRPVVVCQHGLEGTPMDTITRTGNAYRYYRAFSSELAKRGFIVYAPQNPYRGEDRFRVIQRLSNPIKLSLFSYIIRQHERTVEWLRTLPNVDPERIGFYGLSYGGKTAVRIPPLLPNFYAISICSADFNEWILKNVSVEDRHSYLYTGEYEMHEWNMGHVASYAELATLMAPRPFMVERGHDDGVAPDEWVASEYAKVRRHYDQLGLGDKTEIEFFNGPHSIHGENTFRFLHRHLDWPRK